MIMAEQMLPLAEKIAVELGDGWRAEPGCWSNGGDAFLSGPDGVRLHAATGGHQIGDGRVRVNGCLPDGWRDHTPSRHDETAPQDPGDVRMTLAKSPDVLAREIRRRLLPGWSAYLEVTRERKQAADARDADVAGFGDRLVAIAGGRWEWSAHAVRRHGPREDPAVHPGRDRFTVGGYGDPVRADVSVTADGGRVDLDIRDRDALVALAEWVAAWRRALS